MQDLYNAWQSLFDRHSQLLFDLERGLNRERKALLANDLDLLREASLSKEKTTRQVLQIQDQIGQLKEKSIKELGLDSTLNLSDLFENFDQDFKNPLLQRRRDLLRLSNTISRINKFNNRCLDTYMEYIDGIRSVFSLCKTGECQTYSQNGRMADNDYNGRLINRSF